MFLSKKKEPQVFRLLLRESLLLPNHAIVDFVLLTLLDELVVLAHFVDRVRETKRDEQHHEYDWNIIGQSQNADKMFHTLSCFASHVSYPDKIRIRDVYPETRPY